MERLEDDADPLAAKARQRVLAHGGQIETPSMTIEPLSGRSSPAIVINSVDLPDPDGADEPDRLAARDCQS